MKSKLCLSGVLVLAAFVLISSTDAQTQATPANTTHCDTIGSDETWSSAGNVHIVTCNVTVASGVTLTIAEGAIVKFNSGTRLTVNGILRALGTVGNPVYFTSYRDDTIGGDTNGDGASTGARGDWPYIAFNGGTSSLIDHAEIRFGGYSYFGNPSHGAIDLFGASPTIRNSTITQSRYCAIRADLTSFPTFSNNSLVGNDANGLCLDGGTISLDSTWNITNTSYYIRNNVSVAVGTVLTVTPDVVVKFGAGKWLAINGTLRVLGTSAEPVYFTSYRDDTIRGDTDGGGASTGARGDWPYIAFNGGTSSLIDHAEIRFGGYSYFGNPSHGAIDLFGASPTIRNSTITQSKYTAILADSSTPALGCNNILNNDYGIRNATPTITVTAQNQWWGSASGPYHPVLNPSGTGNAVSDGVDFIPWRASSCSPSDLSISKTDSPDPVLAGSSLTYTVVVMNNSPSLATGVRLTDTLPAGVTFRSVLPSQGSCSGTSIITCNLGSLANSASAFVRITVTPMTTGTINNTVSVTSNEFDPNTANNTTEQATTVNPAANLQVSKSDSPDAVTVGKTLTYTVIVMNNGPSVATGVTLTDTLPSSMIFSSVSPSQGNCSGTSIITCTLGALNNGASATVTIIVTTTTPGTITNMASVTGNEPDLNPTNNTVTESTTVRVSVYLPIVLK